MTEVVDAVETECWLFLAEMKQCVMAFVEWLWIHPKDEVLVCVKAITMVHTDPLLIPYSVYNTNNNYYNLALSLAQNETWLFNLFTT